MKHLYHSLRGSFLVLTLLALFAPTTSALGQFGEEENKASIKLISDVSSIAPGKTFSVAVEIEHPGEWHSYYKNAGAAGSALKFDFKLPEGYTAGALKWPVPHIDRVYDMLSFSYGHNAYFILEVTPSKNAKAGESAKLTLDLNIQMCEGDRCDMPQTISTEITLPIAAEPVTNEAAKSIFTEAREALPQTPNDWKVSIASVDKANLVLNIATKTDLTKGGDIYFISDTSIIEPSAKHILKKEGEGYTLTVKLSEDATVPAKLTGIISNKEHKLAEGLPGVLVNLSTAKKAEPKAPKADAAPAKPKKESSKKKEHKIIDDGLSDSAIADMAKNASTEPIHTIGIDQIDDDGYVLSDAGDRILPKNFYFDFDKGNIVDKDGNILGAKKELTFLWAVLLIFLGGMILNLMPCVFPVLGIKVLGFVQLSGNDPKKIKMHGIVFTLGIIVSMWILAGILLAIKASTGDAITWGKQMESPIFVGIMVILLALFALNLFGVFEIGTKLTSAGGELQSKKGYQGSFFSGVLTTLIATPCGAPLLASAMAYTLQQTAIVSLVLFTIFALGVAFPYLVLSFLPKLIDKLPRPGAWMVAFKKSMSFLLLATCAYLLGVFVEQTGKTGIKYMLWSLTIFATAAFIYGTWSPPFTSKKKRWIAGHGLALCFAIFGGYLGFKAVTHKKPEQKLAATIEADEDGWIPWRKGLVDYYRDKSKPVFIDYTADW